MTSARASTPGAGAPTDSPELMALRRRMDAVDARLLALLEARLQIAREMGRVKRRDGLSARDAAREAAVIDRLGARSPVDEQTLRAVWGALFAASLRAQAIDHAPPADERPR